MLRESLIALILSSVLLVLFGCQGEPDSNDAKQAQAKPSKPKPAAKQKVPNKATTGLKKIPYDPSLSILDNIKKNGELVVLTRNAPTTYYYKQEQLVGFEHDLAVAYAQALGVKVRFVVLETVSDILKALEQGKGHIAAAGLTAIENRKNRYLTGPVYYKVQQQLVCRQRGKRLRSIRHIGKIKLVIIADSSYEHELKRRQKKHPKMRWTVTHDDDTEDLLAKVWNKEIDCTIADSNIVAINRRYYPELVVKFNVTKPQPLVWYLGSNAKQLHQHLHNWFKQPQQVKLLTFLNERYYGYIKIYNYVNVKVFQEKIVSELPKYKGVFKKAAKKYQLDWTLLAAQGYQESQWDPKAKSPTGVRGIMMLTQHTAKEVKVENRLDPEQSIYGGAEYFIRIRDRLPKSITGKNRLWIALAAYNIGLGHIYDARRLARRLNKNPDTWRGLKSVLPLLRNKKYYRTLRYGYARGSEPVRYVARIRDFHDILINFLKSNKAKLADKKDK